ncbi:MAG: thioesterase family protein [Gammaproteobacteria bacterium]|nr:thioesterase family protein [Gammaproteobacteria bacterium]
MDNDIYAHVNNVHYYSFFDTVIAHYLIHEGGLDIHAGAVIGLCVESACRYRRPIAFPQAVDAGLRVGHLGNSSVRYEVGLFGEGEDEVAAEGHFVHVFVDRATRRPQSLPVPIREALARIAAGPATRAQSSSERSR